MRILFRTMLDSNVMRCLASLRAVTAACCIVCSISAASLAYGRPGQQAGNAKAQDGAPSGLYVKVQLANSVKISALKSGDVLEGKLAADVYSGDQEMFPAGSVVHLTVDHLGRRKKTLNDHWPWAIKVFLPRHESYPMFRAATVFLPDKTGIPLHVSLISIGRKAGVRARTKTRTPQPEDRSVDASSPKGSDLGAARKDLGTMVTLEAVRPDLANVASTPERTPPSGSQVLASGTQASVILLRGLSASKSRPGDSIEARLVQPVQIGGKIVLPEGTVFEGKVVKSTPPRVLSRAGSIYFTFTGLTLPGGSGVPVTASVTRAEIDAASQTTLDSEGRLKGGNLGKAWLLANVGVTVGLSKVADDGLQLLIQTIVAAATNASTAGTARIVAASVSGVFLLTRHGRDVMLPPFTEMEISLDRPVSLPELQPRSVAPPSPSIVTFTTESLDFQSELCYRSICNLRTYLYCN